MWQAILEFLKKAATKAGTVAKGAVKGAVEHPFKTLINATPPGQLYNAFASMGKQKPTAEPAAPPARPMGADMGITGMIGNNTPGQAAQTIQPQQQSIIPAQYQQFIRQGGMQYVPGPEGSVIGGQGGEVMPGYEMRSTTIPPAYRSMDQVQQVPPWMQQKPDVGFMRGLINATTGQPQPEGLMDVSQGRRTAYYTGELIPKIIMSKLGQPSPAEATAQQQQIESSEQLQRTRKEQEITPEYMDSLKKAMERLPKLDENGKLLLYQELVSRYPQRSAELKRMIFPQSQDTWAETLGNIIASTSIR